jgi:hypothetical protein
MARSFRDAGHLPKQRDAGEQPQPAEELPRQRRGVTPQLHGRYPDYDVLALAPHWDPVTREVVLKRVAEPPPIRFFSEVEARTLGAFCDVVMAQDAEPRIPVLNMVDAKLHARELDGFRHADLPEDPETWQLVARGLDEVAGGDFAALTLNEQQAIVERFSVGELSGGVWDEIPAGKAWGVVMRHVLSMFYSHPWAWNEIGYGGPRYPRGYIRIGAGLREPAVSPEEVDVDPVQDPAAP